MAVHVWIVSSKYSGNRYFTTDRGVVDEELQVAREEGYDDDEITVEEEWWSDEMYERTSATAKDFPGW